MTQRAPGTSGGGGVDVGAMREAATALVHGIYRLVKASQFYTDATNEAITALTTSSFNAVVQFCRAMSADAATVTFIGDAVFVNGQILKASRETHALTVELRGMLAVCEVTELTLKVDVGRDGLGRFARLLADIGRDHSLAPRLAAGEIPGISARKAVFTGAGLGDVEAPAVRASRTYALSVLTVQRVLGGARNQAPKTEQDERELPRLIKRVAQRIVGQVDDDGRLLVALAAVAGASVDPAVIAVGSAILGVAMLRQLTTDRALLSNAATAALLHDAGRVQLASSGEGPQRTLNEDELDQVAPRSAVILTAMGKLHAPARLRTVLVYEAWLQRRAHRLGPPYQGRRTLTVLSRILGVARAFSELRAADTDGKLSVDDALQLLSNRASDGTERAFVKLLVGALGIFPAGTMVELSTGELAVVMGTPAMPIDYVRPPVKILYDANATLLDAPLDVDLAGPRAPGDPLRFIRRNIDADDQQLKAMRSYVLAATAATRRAAIVEDPVPVPAPPPVVAPPPAPAPPAVAPRPPPAAAQVAAAESPAPPQARPMTGPTVRAQVSPLSLDPPSAFLVPGARHEPHPPGPDGVRGAHDPPSTRSGVATTRADEPPSSSSSPGKRRELRPIVPRDDAGPDEPPSARSSPGRTRPDEPPSARSSPGRTRPDEPPSARSSPGSTAGGANSKPIPGALGAAPPRKRELRPIVPRNTPAPLRLDIDEPPSTKSAIAALIAAPAQTDTPAPPDSTSGTPPVPGVKRRDARPIVPRTDTPSPAKAPEQLVAEEARAAKRTDSAPPTGIRGAIFGGRIPAPAAAPQAPPGAPQTPAAPPVSPASPPEPAAPAAARPGKPPQATTVPAMPAVSDLSAAVSPATPGLAQPTRQVNWQDYGKLIKGDAAVRATPPPAPAVVAPPPPPPPEPERPARAAHDDLLAAFLADAPLPPSDPPPPPDDENSS